MSDTRRENFSSLDQSAEARQDEGHHGHPVVHVMRSAVVQPGLKRVKEKPFHNPISRRFHILEPSHEGYPHFLLKKQADLCLAIL